MRKFIFVRTEISFLPNGTKFPFGRRQNFLPQGNKFSCRRKFSSVRTKIWRSAEGKKSTFEGGEIFLRKKKNFRT